MQVIGNSLRLEWSLDFKFRLPQIISAHGNGGTQLNKHDRLSNKTFHTNLTHISLQVSFDFWEWKYNWITFLCYLDEICFCFHEFNNKYVLTGLEEDFLVKEVQKFVWTWSCYNKPWNKLFDLQEKVSFY